MNQQVIGTISGMEQRSGGWVAVAVQAPDRNYPVKLSTKKPELISQAQQLLGQLVTAGYNESESNNINPNNGQPYMNRYLEALALGSVDLVGMPTRIQPQQFVPQNFQPQPVATNQPQSVTFTPPPQQPQPQPQPAPLPQAVQDMREAKIHRQTASKVAVQLLSFLDKEEQNLASLVRISEQLVHYYAEGVVWTVPPGYDGEAQDAQAQQQHQQQVHRDPTDGYPLSPPPSDDAPDDIPF